MDGQRVSEDQTVNNSSCLEGANSSRSVVL
jgi:hypothetical protein